MRTLEETLRSLQEEKGHRSSTLEALRSAQGGVERGRLRHFVGASLDRLASKLLTGETATAGSAGEARAAT